VHNVEDLVSEFTWVDVTAMCVVGNEGNVKGADMRNVRETLEEVVLQMLVKCRQHAVRCNVPNPCSR
jgi:uncharacterized Fe-S cluster-containing protein